MDQDIGLAVGQRGAHDHGVQAGDPHGRLAADGLGPGVLLLGRHAALVELVPERPHLVALRRERLGVLRLAAPRVELRQRVDRRQIAGAAPEGTRLGRPFGRKKWRRGRRGNDVLRHIHELDARVDVFPRELLSSRLKNWTEIDSVWREHAHSSRLRRIVRALARHARGRPVVVPVAEAPDGVEVPDDGLAIGREPTWVQCSVIPKRSEVLVREILFIPELSDHGQALGRDLLVGIVVPFFRQPLVRLGLETLGLLRRHRSPVKELALHLDVHGDRGLVSSANRLERALGIHVVGLAG